MRILITGGTGFLGKKVAYHFTQNGHRVRVLGRNARVGETLNREGISFFRASLSEKEKLNGACADQDVVVHCAALASPFGKYEDFHQANVLGTENIVEAALSNGVRRFVNISTPSLYFNYRDRLNIKESEPIPKPVTHYAATKWKADEIVEKARKKDFVTIGLRPRGIFGPGDSNVLPRVIAAEKNGVFPVIGGGNSYVDLTYIDNAVSAIELAMHADSSLSGRVYNITNGTPITVKEMASKLFGRMGKDVRFRNLPFPLAHTLAGFLEGFYSLFKPGKEPPLTRYGVGLMAKSQTLDISSAKTDLGYQPRVGLDEGFDNFVRWWRESEKH